MLLMFICGLFKVDQATQGPAWLNWLSIKTQTDAECRVNLLVKHYEEQITTFDERRKNEVCRTYHQINFQLAIYY